MKWQVRSAECEEEETLSAKTPASKAEMVPPEALFVSNLML